MNDCRSKHVYPVFINELRDGLVGVDEELLPLIQGSSHWCRSRGSGLGGKNGITQGWVIDHTWRTQEALDLPHKGLRLSSPKQPLPEANIWSDPPFNSLEAWIEWTQLIMFLKEEYLLSQKKALVEGSLHNEDPRYSWAYSGCQWLMDLFYATIDQNINLLENPQETASRGSQIRPYLIL